VALEATNTPAELTFLSRSILIWPPSASLPSPEPSRGFIDHCYQRLTLHVVIGQCVAPQQCCFECSLIAVAHEIDMDNVSFRRSLAADRISRLRPGIGNAAVACNRGLHAGQMPYTFEQIAGEGIPLLQRFVSIGRQQYSEGQHVVRIKSELRALKSNKGADREARTRQ